MKRIFVQLIVLCAAVPALAAAEPETKPADVYVGVYINQVYGVSLKENKFSADFYECCFGRWGISQDRKASSLRVWIMILPGPVNSQIRPSPLKRVDFNPPTFLTP